MFGSNVFSQVLSAASLVMDSIEEAHALRVWHEYSKFRCGECSSPGCYAFNALDMIANVSLATYLEFNLSPWVFDWKPSIQLSVMRQRRSPLS